MSDTDNSTPYTMPKKPRTCLKCNKEFQSTGPGNRICNPCSALNYKTVVHGEPIKTPITTKKRIE